MARLEVTLSVKGHGIAISDRPGAALFEEDKERVDVFLRPHYGEDPAHGNLTVTVRRDEYHELFPEGYGYDLVLAPLQDGRKKPTAMRPGEV